MKSLKGKFIRGAMWNSFAQGGKQVINLVLMIVLAWLLEPNDFGLLGMTVVFTGFLGYFSECGLKSSLIKKDQVDKLDTNTVFWSSLAFSLITYAAIFAVAPLIAMFYKQPELVPIARVLGLSFIIASFGFVPEALEQKKLRYNRLAMIQVSSLLISGASTVVLAVMGFGVWALVWQQVLMRGCDVIGFVIVIRWRPSFIFSFSRFKELIGFGVHVTMNHMIKFFSENVDYLLVGKLLGPTALGIYTIAFRLSRYPVEKLLGVMGLMLFPAFALIQRDYQRLRRNMMRFSAYGAIVLVPFLLLVFMFTESFIRLTISVKWIEAAPLMRIFIGYVMVFCFCFGDEQILMVTERIGLLNLIKAVSSMVILVVGSWAVDYAGAIGMAWTYTLCVGLYYVLLKLLVLRRIELSVWEYLISLRKVSIYICSLLIGMLLVYWLPAGDLMKMLLAGMVLISTCVFYWLFQWPIVIWPNKIDFDGPLVTELITDDKKQWDSAS